MYKEYKSISLTTLILGFTLAAGTAFADTQSPAGAPPPPQTNSIVPAPAPAPAPAATNTVAVAPAPGPDAVLKLNDSLSTLLKAFNNQTTGASVIISKAQVNATRAVELAGNIHYSKNLGPDRKAALDANGSYRYPETPDAVPTTTFSGEVQIDLIKLFGDKTISSLGDELQKDLAQATLDAKRDYGSAVEIKNDVQPSTGPKGEFKGLTADVDYKIDLTQLATNKVSEVQIAQAKVKFSLTPQGGTVNVTLISNPKYSGFQAEGKGLKEWIEALLKQDPETVGEVTSIIQFVDSAITEQLSQNPAPEAPAPAPAPAPVPRP